MVDAARKTDHQLESLSRRSQELLDVVRQMGETENLQDLMNLLTKEVCRLLETDRCSLFIVSENRQEIRSRVADGTSEIRIPLRTGIAGAVIDEGKTLVIEDAYSDNRFNKDVDLKTGYRTKNLACTPLSLWNGEVIGCIQAINKEDGFAAEDIKFLETFASQAAWALRAAHERNQKDVRIKQLEIIAELERLTIQTVPLEDFMQTAIDLSSRAVQAQAGSILLLDDEKRLQFSYRVGQKSDELKVLTIAQSEGFAGKALFTGKPVIENNVGHSNVHCRSIDESLEMTTKSIVAIPLFLVGIEGQNSRAIGVLECINHVSGSFTEEDVFFLQTISSQISAMIARRRLLSEREQAQRLVTIGQMAGTIIHDIKNPLSIIRSICDVFEQDLIKVDEKGKEYLSLIGKQVDRCSTMSQEILSFVRGEQSYHFEDLECDDFLDSIRAVLDLEAESYGVKAIWQRQGSGTIKVDAEKLRRVIFNLTSNAFSAMKDTENATLAISTEIVADRLKIRISDNGPGIPEGIVDTVFEAFVTQGKRDGTGLGLHICQRIVEGHKGKISVEKTGPEGTTFLIDIPAEYLQVLELNFND